MTIKFSAFLFFLISLCGMLFVQASSPKPNYAGHYELADAKAGRSFSLDIKQTGSRAQVSFAAAMTDGSSTAAGKGRGHMDDGVLEIDFTDNLKNEGTCTLQPKKTGPGYILSMRVIKVINLEPVHFYGDILLKKMSDQSTHQFSTEKL
jgi:hypothetical protein